MTPLALTQSRKKTLWSMPRCSACDNEQTMWDKIEYNRPIHVYKFTVYMCPLNENESRTLEEKWDCDVSVACITNGVCNKNLAHFCTVCSSVKVMGLGNENSHLAIPSFLLSKQWWNLSFSYISVVENFVQYFFYESYFREKRYTSAYVNIDPFGDWSLINDKLMDSTEHLN